MFNDHLPQPDWYPPDPSNQMLLRWWDGNAWGPQHVTWDPATNGWNTPPVPPPPGPAQHPTPAKTAVTWPAPDELILLEIDAVRKGGGVARIKVTTSSLQISATGGLSTWKTLLGMASLGVSYAATGIASVHGGKIEVPLKVVDAAYVSNSRMPWADLMVIVAGETVPMHMAWASAQLAADSISASLAGGHEASLFAEAWQASRQPRTEPRKVRNKRIGQALKDGQLTQQDFTFLTRKADLEDQMRAYL